MRTHLRGIPLFGVAFVAFFGSLIAIGLVTSRISRSYLRSVVRGEPPSWLAVLERFRAYSAQEEFIGDHPLWVAEIRAGRNPNAGEIHG